MRSGHCSGRTLIEGRLLTLTRSIVGRYVWNGGKTGASEDKVFLDSKLVSVLEDWRKRCVETPEARYALMRIRNAQSTAMLYGNCDQQVKRSDCKEWGGAAAAHLPNAD